MVSCSKDTSTPCRSVLGCSKLKVNLILGSVLPPCELMMQTRPVFLSVVGVGASNNKTKLGTSMKYKLEGTATVISSFIAGWKLKHCFFQN